MSDVGNDWFQVYLSELTTRLSLKYMATLRRCNYNADVFGNFEILYRIGSMLLRIVNERGSVAVFLSPVWAPHDEHELSKVMAVLPNDDGSTVSGWVDVGAFNEVIGLLDRVMPSLIATFSSKQRVNELKNRLDT